MVILDYYVYAAYFVHIIINITIGCYIYNKYKHAMQKLKDIT